MIRRSLASLALVLFAAGCLPTPLDSDAGRIDAGPLGDDASVPPDAVMDGGVDAATDAGPPTAIFRAPHEGDDPSTFFDLPWPSEARLTPVGTPDLSAFPAPSRGLVRDYLDAIEISQDGYSTLGSVYFRFTHDVDVATLPDTLEESVAAGASVFLVPLSDGSTSATRHPAIVRWEPRVTEYWPGRTLAIRPGDGFPLLPDTLYAAVVTDRVRAVGGATFDRDADFEAVVAGDSSVAAVVESYGPALTRLEELGIPPASIVSLAIFRTQDPTALLATTADWVRETMPAPTIVESEWSTRESSATLTVLHGRYSGAPTFQEGEIPYRATGGGIRLDADGVPVLEGTYTARFALTIPVSPMPEGGYPIVLYGHGTGGNFRSFIDDDTAELLAAQGYAAMGIDAPVHGERTPPPIDDTIFFNILNPDAVRCNPVQGALDHVVQGVVARNLVVPRAILERDGREVRIDASRVYYLGHSQGSLVGPLYFAVDDTPIAAVFSAGGSMIGHTLREKTAPVDIPTLVRSLLRFSGSSTADAFEREGFTLEHPIVTILQGWVDISDPGNYAPLAFARPRPGFPPRSVIATEGLLDEYVAPSSAEAMAVAFRMPIAAPVAREIEGLRFLGLTSEPGVVTANVQGGMTGALLQFAEEGHFGFFNDERARERISSFFASLEAGPPGTLPGP